MEKTFNEKDNSTLSKKGVSKEQVLEQIAQFKEGYPFTRLTSSAKLNDGIVNIDPEKHDLISEFDNSKLSIMKFVPASGAATRMFKELFEFRDNVASDKSVVDNKSLSYFFSHLESFAFANDLRGAFKKVKGYSLEKALKQNEYDTVLDVLLSGQGMNYGNLPKGLLKFHKYEGSERTPTQEHLIEGEQYSFKNNTVKIHFTVSPEHQESFTMHVEDAISKLDSEFEISFSTQKPSTDTIAVDLHNIPFRMDNDEILFRPAGHGALLENLNELESDIIFIKNIDNVVPDRLKQDTIEYKKALAGVLLKYQEKTFDLLRKNDSGHDISQQGKELLEEMGFRGQLSPVQIAEKLNRPIRVCGMVKNEGEPGGGPFWVSDKVNNQSLQIVESAQVDLKDENQMAIFKSSTHFNPVDLVCGVRNYKGEKFNLLKYRDSDTGFISEKSKSGRSLKAMELPGLWNGSMAYWNTIFVEVPLSTFNPVKTVNDLLKENHC